jgi:hypothetical protein
MYTAQANAHGNIIVCKGSDVRNSYRIVFTGTYAECLQYKAIFIDMPDTRTDAQKALSLAYAERGLEDRTKPIRQLPTFNGWTDTQITAYLESL